jgi:hypothetical protein
MKFGKGIGFNWPLGRICLGPFDKRGLRPNLLTGQTNRARIGPALRWRAALAVKRLTDQRRWCRPPAAALLMGSLRQGAAVQWTASRGGGVDVSTQHTAEVLSVPAAGALRQWCPGTGGGKRGTAEVRPVEKHWASGANEGGGAAPSPGKNWGGWRDWKRTA